MTGQSQTYLSSATNATTKSKTEFDQAERMAFEYCKAMLRGMAGCSLPDLEQAAYSYLCQSFRDSGIEVGETWSRAKASKWAEWWHTRHTASRTTRPHSEYSAAQALRGRQVAAIRKKSRADWTALQAQLARHQGGKVAEIAGRFGCSERSVFRLSKRRFPKLVLVILGQALNLTHGKSSVVATSDIQAIDSKEQLRRGRVPADPRPAGEQIDEIDRLGAAIPDLLRGWWAAQGL